MSKSQRPTAIPAIDFTKPQRKVVPLTPAQAYSLVFCTRDSTLYQELRQEWKLYTSADDATVKKYKHLFPSQHNLKLPFVAFQQVVLKDKITTATEDELSAVQEYIETRFEEDLSRRECPWKALKVDDSQSDADLERQYVKE